MMLYETQADRANESGVFNALATKYNCGVEACPTLSAVDGYLLDKEGNRAAVVEIKTRRNAHDLYPTYMLSAVKHKNLVYISTQSAIPALLIVNFTDGLYATKIKSDYPTALGGRYDRGDPNDRETCVYIPIQEFKAL
tara:strand:- start:512 stop:925 length:414 start_codon:yes stop_codon:yes gene_type:complete